MRLRLPCFLLFLLALVCAPSAKAYSLLTHEQLIDLTWEDSIVPLLLSRYPTLTPEELEHARAYAYGGCVIQDIGYYPLGDTFFSDLTHYVRSGDFVVNLFRNAGNADELAFAVGALSHYIGDTYGHSEATNLAVPVEFPKLRARYGERVNYAEGERQHVRTEFAFDIDQIAHHRFAPVHYLRHVGLEVPTKQLALAFYQTYGISEDFNVHRGRRINVRAYRFAVRRFIPRIAYAINLLHRNDAPAEVPNQELVRLGAAIATVEQQNGWAAYRRKPGPGTYLLAGLLYVLPKIGPLQLAAVKGPTSETEAAYIHSVSDSVHVLKQTLQRFTPPPTTRPSAQVAAAADTTSDPAPSAPMLPKPGAAQDVPRDSADRRHPLVNRDLDTGLPVIPASYRLTDETYARLAHRLASQPDQPVPPGVKDDILAFYRSLEPDFATKTSPTAWATLQADLATLRAMPTSNEPEPFPTYAQLAGSMGDDSTRRNP